MFLPDGKPAALARIGLLTLPRPGDVPASPAVTTADEAGAFSFEVNPASAFSLHAHLAPAALVSLPRVSGGQRVTIRLVPGDRLGGTVVDGVTGKPIADASIEASEWEISPFVALDPGFGHIRGTTDAKGRFALAGLALSGRQVIRARARGYATATTGTVPPSGLVLRLDPGHDVIGAITDTSGRPISQATIILRPTLRRGLDAVTLRSNSTGRFEALGLRIVPYDITITAPGFALYVKDVIAPDLNSLAVTLERSARATGRFVDEEEKPLKGKARVRTSQGQPMPPDADLHITAEAAVNGTFALAGLKSGTNVIELQALGFSPIERTVEVARPGETVSLGDVTFEQGLTIKGRVRTADDQPVPGARIQAAGTVRTGPGPIVPLLAHSDGGGGFEIKGLRAEPYQLSVTADGFARQARRASPPEGSLEFTLRPAVRLSGRLVDESEQPVARGRVSAQKGADQTDSVSGLSTADGTFSLDLGDVGDTQLSVVAEGFTRFSMSVLVEGETDLGDLILSRGTRLRGSVVDSKGTPVVGARVENRTTQQIQPTFAETDEKGRFEMTGASPGRVRLVATHPHFSPNQTLVEVKEGEEPEETQITLGSGARIEGVVRHRDNTPVGQALVQLMGGSFSDTTRPPTGSPMTLTQGDGSFVFEHVFPGALNVLLMTGQQGLYTNVDQRAISVAEGETASVSLTLKSTTVRGIVRRKEGPASGLRVSVTGGLIMMSTAQDRLASLVGDIPWRSAVTDAEGRFALRVAGPLKGRLNVADGRSTLASKDVEIPDIDEVSLPVDLLGIRVSGRVVDAEGRAIPEASANAVRTLVPGAPAGTRSSTVRADNAGNFAFELDPGEYRVSVTADGFAASSPVSTSVTTSEVRIGDITLSRGGSLSGRVMLRGLPVSGARVDAGSSTSENIPVQYTGPDGYFTFKGLPEGEVRLIASDAIGHVGVHFSSPGSADPIEIKLLPAARIEVTVVGPREALSETNVMMLKMDDIPHRIFTRADASGRSVLFAPAGAVTINATSGTRGGDAVVQAVMGETVAVTIELKPPKTPPSK